MFSFGMFISNPGPGSYKADSYERLLIYSQLWVYIALSALDNMALLQCAVSRLSKS